jgi:hypothetical protein
MIRGVPEGKSSGTWGRNDPAGSLLTSDSVRRRKREKTRTEEAVREGRFMEFTPCGVRAGGTDKQLSASWFRKSVAGE